jgi:hypothetical protein
VINFEIVPNKEPFQIKNHMQRTHLYILCIYRRRRSKYSKSELFPLIFFSIFTWRTPGNVLAPTPSNPPRVKCGYIGTNYWEDGKEASKK